MAATIVSAWNTPTHACLALRVDELDPFGKTVPTEYIGTVRLTELRDLEPDVKRAKLIEACRAERLRSLSLQIISAAFFQTAEVPEGLEAGMTVEL